MRILFLGEGWFGSCARACSYALRRLGCDVREVDPHDFCNSWSGGISRIVAKAIHPIGVNQYNRSILETAQAFSPDVLFAFKGSLVYEETLTRLRKSGITLVNFFPDTSPFAHGRTLAASLKCYDIVFYTKRHWERHVIPSFPPSVCFKYLPHGYDTDVHYPRILDLRERTDYGSDVSFAGTYTEAKASLLAQVLDRQAEFRLAIWGNQWKERCGSSELESSIRGRAALGTSYTNVLCASTINLGLLSGVVRGVPEGDQTTTRTFEIPAVGAFMIHERTEELAQIFDEDKEVVCFNSPDELRDKLTFYLRRPAARDRIAERGMRRCVPAYSYDERMRSLLRITIDVMSS